MKRLPWVPQGLEIDPGPRAPLGTVGWSCPACLVQFHHWRRRECTQLRPAPLARPPRPALTCSCGMGGLRACPPRMARACSLRGEERGGFSLEGAGTRELELGLGKGERPTKLSAVESLTQVEDSELRERRHHRRPQAACREAGLLWGSDTLRQQSPLQTVAAVSLKAVQECHLTVEGGKDCSKCRRDRTQDRSGFRFTQAPEILLETPGKGRPFWHRSLISPFLL